MRCRLSELHLILITVLAVSADTWNYTDISEWTGICQNGQIQSPIDLEDSMTDVKFYTPFTFTNYDVSNSATVKNNGHSIAIYFNGKNIPLPTLSGGGLEDSYVFDHFHFHWKSEHTVNGDRFPLEMHLVHYSSKYSSLSKAAQHPEGIAVLGVLFELSLDNDPDFVPLVEAMKQVYLYPNNETNLQTAIAARRFLPRNTGEYYRYIGSLTTPSCNEGVIWTVFAEHLPISTDQIKYLEGMYSVNGPLQWNYRPVQPLNGRVVSMRSARSLRNEGPRTVNASTILLLLCILPLIHNKL